MDWTIIYSIILTLLPISELRIGLPLAINFAIQNKLPIWTVFTLIVFVNILLIFFIFWFLDHLHSRLFRWKFYNKNFSKFLKKFQKKIDKFEKKHASVGMFALTLFVAIPLPGTGAWTGSLLAWILGLKRKESVLAISLGVLIAGILILLGTLGFLSIFS